MLARLLEFYAGFAKKKKTRARYGLPLTSPSSSTMIGSCLRNNAVKWMRWAAVNPQFRAKHTKYVQKSVTGTAIIYIDLPYHLIISSECFYCVPVAHAVKYYKGNCKIKANLAFSDEYSRSPQPGEVRESLESSLQRPHLDRKRLKEMLLLVEQHTGIWKRKVDHSELPPDQKLASNILRHLMSCAEECPPSVVATVCNLVTATVCLISFSVIVTVTKAGVETGHGFKYSSEQLRHYAFEIRFPFLGLRTRT